MPLSEGTRQIAINPAWASATTKGNALTDDRIDPDDSSLTPPIDIADGYPASFSTSGGNTPRRKVINELFYREDSAIKDIINFGVLPWDVDVDTLEGGTKQRAGALYQALEDNGPTYSNAIDPTTSGQTVWEAIGGSLGAPDAPAAPTAIASNGELDWSWACPKDNGAMVTSFDLEWRQSGGTFAAISNLPTARYLLTGLTNGTTYEARIRATNSVGVSGYGATGSAIPVASAPGGGTSFALRADTGDASGEVDLNWLAPDDNGAPITQYRYQWKSGGQNYSGGRSGTTTSTSVTVDSLTDGTEYDFRVRATNSVGNGPNSEEASATPESPTPPPPADTAPDAPTNIEGTPRLPLIVDWTWELPNSNGGQRIEDYDFQWRYQGDSWSNANLTSGLELSYMRITVADTSTGVQARVRASNSVGNSGWSGTVTVTSGDLLDSPTQRHRFTSSQTWTWPYDDLERATVTLFGRDFIDSNSSRNIVLDNSNWQGGVSDGTTLWFIDTLPNPDMAVAYTAATRARDSSRDIALGNIGYVGGVSDGTTLWFITATNPDTAFAYNASTRARDSSRDITLGNSGWQGGVSDGTTLWFITTGSGGMAVAYTAATRARDSSRDIALGSSFGWRGGVSDGTTLWFLTSTNPDTAFAYNASTRARDSSRDITLGDSEWEGGVSDGTTLWFLTATNPDTAFAYNAPSLAQVITSGATYTTDGDADGFVSQTLTGIADNQSFAITIGGSGFAEVYPQI